MREYFEQWIAFFRYHIEQFLRDKAQAKRESDEMKSHYPTPTVEGVIARVKDKVDWSGKRENARIKAMAIRNVEEYHGIKPKRKVTEYERFIIGCIPKESVGIIEKELARKSREKITEDYDIVYTDFLTAEELFAKRKSAIEGGHVTQLEIEEMTKRYKEMK